MTCIWVITYPMYLWDRSQTFVRGPDAKNFGANNFQPPPFFGRQNFSGPPWKIGINPTENHKDSIVRGSNFFSPSPFSDLQNFKDPLFASSVSEWSLLFR